MTKITRDKTDTLNNRWLIEQEDGTTISVILPASVQTAEQAVVMWPRIQAELTAIDKTPEPAPDIPTLEQRIAALETEVATLKSRR